MPQTKPTTPDLKLVSTAFPDTAISVSNIGVWIGQSHILSGVNLDIPKRGVTCLVGPSGAGKSTLLRCLNRINDDTPGFRISGAVSIDGQDIYEGYPDVTKLRSKVGMVFQRPCVFPRSIADNVVFGVRDRKLKPNEKQELVEKSLRQVALWDEVKSRLSETATCLSVGQQQRLCIARALATEPGILLLDEPTASVDPVSVRAIEDLIISLKDRYTVIVVSHDIRQTKAIADHVVFLCDGQLIESGPRNAMFSMCASDKTRLYLGEEYCDC